MITNQIPGGNIEVVSVNGRDIELDVELRDTAGDWFYWSFKAVFPANCASAAGRTPPAPSCRT